ncbi:MAG: hypothetical protein PVS2B2_21710 [Candidatus Acidiferrum sp.]
MVKDRQVDTWVETAPLANLAVTIEAVLTDDKGHVGCRAYGRPAPSNQDGNWILTWSGAASYWHYQCNSVQVQSNRTYDLAIRVTDVGAGIEKVIVTPRFTGGGNELP